MKTRYTILLWGYIVTSIALFLFSYTQIDLNLTLSRASAVQTLQKSFQYVGYYNRPVSTFIYLCIVGLLFGLYIAALGAARKGVLTVHGVWKLIGVVTVLLVFSYPAAFSYDFFNYLFTAKTVLVYHKNPYLVTPLQFAGIDPWTNFMRWTHLSSAYTPLWIGLSLVPFALGLGYFLPVLFFTKLAIAGFYIVACVGIVKIMDHEDVKHAATSLVLFALNPLIIIETLVSGHNDIVLVAFAMVAIALLVRNRYMSAWWVLAVSIAAKFMTIFLIPVFWLNKSRRWMLVAMIAGLVVVIARRGILPWYMVWVWPFIALSPQLTQIIVLAGFFSFGLLLTYATYLYVGSYDPWVVGVNQWLPYASLGIGAMFLLLYKYWVYVVDRKK